MDLEVGETSSSSNVYLEENKMRDLRRVYQAVPGLETIIHLIFTHEEMRPRMHQQIHSMQSLIVDLKSTIRGSMEERVSNIGSSISGIIRLPDGSKQSSYVVAQYGIIKHHTSFNFNWILN